MTISETKVVNAENQVVNTDKNINVGGLLNIDLSGRTTETVAVTNPDNTQTVTTKTVETGLFNIQTGGTTTVNTYAANNNETPIASSTTDYG